MAKILKNNHKYIQHIILLSCILLVVSFSFLVFRKTVAHAASTIVVNSTSDVISDDGSCTLREAIISSNTDTASGATLGECIAGSGIDTVNFSIAPFDGSVKTFQPASDYDAISEEVIINGYTQDIADPNSASSPNPFDGTLLIEIDGSNAGTGFYFVGGASGSAGSEIRGLVINNFPFNAIRIDAQNIKVQGNYIGTNADGTSAAGNQVGVNWEGVGDHDDGANALVGGLLPAERNIISGNTNGGTASGSYPTNGWTFQGNYIGVAADGVTGIGNATAGGAGSISIDICEDVTVGGSVAGAGNVISGNLSHGLAPDRVTNLTIQGNLIGTDYTGTVALGNGSGGLGGAGITLQQVTGVIGGDTAFERNIIANSPGDGIYLNNSDGMVIQGNHIGTGILGTEDFPNGQNGISMNLGSSGNLIGGANTGEGNIIRSSDQAGIVIADDSDGTTANSILGNSIFDNGEIGIDLRPLYGESANDSSDADSGANDLLNYIDDFEYEEIGPDTELTFTLDVPAGDYRIEFFSNTTADTSGNGEGETYIGRAEVTSLGAGSSSFSHTLVGLTGLTNISATTTEIDVLATSGFGSTSEFSQIATEPGVDLPSVDTNLTKTLLNPELVTIDSDIVYQFTLTNEGSVGFDLTHLVGNNPGANSLVFDVLAPELTYISEDNDDVTCTDFAAASALGPTSLANHLDHRLINCGYTGASSVLAMGDTFTFNMTVHVEPSSDLVFTNYALSSVDPSDPDGAALGEAFASGNDIIDEIGGRNGNFAAAQYPLPVLATTTTTTTTTVIEPSQIVSGNLPSTGSPVLLLVFFGLILAVIGYVLIRKKSLISK
jgi:CSLREA domain-containing protein/LPXTG-motif cell wall-anchored protein